MKIKERMMVEENKGVDDIGEDVDKVKLGKVENMMLENEKIEKGEKVIVKDGG